MGSRLRSRGIGTNIKTRFNSLAERLLIESPRAWLCRTPYRTVFISNFVVTRRKSLCVNGFVLKVANSERLIIDEALSARSLSFGHLNRIVTDQLLSAYVVSS